MASTSDSSLPLLGVLVVLAALITHGPVACKRKVEISQVSVQPTELKDTDKAVTQARSGKLGMRARVSYSDIEAIARSELPEQYPVMGSKRICKRVLGIEACGTTNWDLLVTRGKTLTITGVRQQAQIDLPLGFEGKAGIEGKVARALGLSTLDVRGVAMANIKLGLDMNADWCPVIRTNVTYNWTEKPTIAWRNRFDLDLEKIASEALNKQLATLEPRLNRAINCELFRAELAKYWRSYTFPLNLPESQRAYLNVVPSGFAFSGIQTENDKLGVSFVIDAMTSVESNPVAEEKMLLPDLKRVDFQASRTDFDLLLRADYKQLQEVLEPRLIDKTFASTTAAGQVSVRVTSAGISGNTEGVTVALGFVAQLPASRGDTTGIVYLQAIPVVDSTLERLSLTQIRFSRILDNQLWSVISNVFEGQIVDAIRKGAVFDLADQTRKLETRLLEQLQDPARTGGVLVQASNLTLRLVQLIPESSALVARANVSAELDIEIPLTVIQKPLK